MKGTAIAGLLLALGCGLGRSVEVPLSPVGGSGVSGTVRLEHTICKSPCVTTLFALSGPAGTRGAVRMGSCSAPGELMGSLHSTDPTFAEPISYVSDLDELRGKACVQVVAEVEGAEPTVLACGDIP